MVQRIPDDQSLSILRPEDLGKSTKHPVTLFQLINCLLCLWVAHECAQWPGDQYVFVTDRDAGVFAANVDADDPCCVIDALQLVKVAPHLFVRQVHSIHMVGPHC